MQRLALALAAMALLGAAFASPGPFVAIGCGIGALGTGWLVYQRRALPGQRRLVGAAAMALGTIGCMLGVLRVVLVLEAIAHVERMLG
jgi:hypothetical protein